MHRHFQLHEIEMLQRETIWKDISTLGYLHTLRYIDILVYLVQNRCILTRAPHRLNFYQSDTCWKVSVKYRRFCFYFTTLIRASKWGNWGPKTFLQMHLLLREQIYFHKISSGTWDSPPVTCPSTCLGWRLVSSHHRSWKGPVLSSLRL